MNSKIGNEILTDRVRLERVIDALKDAIWCAQREALPDRRIINKWRKLMGWNPLDGLKEIADYKET